MNPFRNAIKTFDLLPDALKPAFHTAFNDDWSDLESNGNPLEHGIDPDPDEREAAAINYILEWAGWMCDLDAPEPKLLSEPELSDRYKQDPAMTRAWLSILADAYDLIPFGEAIESTFGGEHISEGHFLDVEPEFGLGPIFIPSEITITVEDDADNPVPYTFIVTGLSVSRKD